MTGRARREDAVTPEAIEEAVTLYADARHRKRRIDVLPDSCRPVTLDDAYAVQAALNARLGATHGTVCGRKIGCTTPVMQRYLEIAHPCAGALYEHRTFAAPATVAYADHWRPGVECEIAVRLARSLPAAAAPFDRDIIADAVDACMAAIEIVDDRYEDFRALDTPTLIADDFFSAGAVLGTPVTAWRGVDLAAAGGVMAINGVRVGAGTGADVMGHPFEALTWLANHAAASGQPLQAGDVVLTGSVVETKWVEPGDTVHVAIEGLGEASVTFAR